MQAMVKTLTLLLALVLGAGAGFADDRLIAEALDDLGRKVDKLNSTLSRGGGGGSSPGDNEMWRASHKLYLAELAWREAWMAAAEAQRLREKAEDLKDDGKRIREEWNAIFTPEFLGRNFKLERHEKWDAEYRAKHPYPTFSSIK